MATDRNETTAELIERRKVTDLFCAYVVYGAEYVVAFAVAMTGSKFAVKCSAMSAAMRRPDDNPVCRCVTAAGPAMTNAQRAPNRILSRSPPLARDKNIAATHNY